MSADADVLQATRCWLERAVIGLNLCPFAKAVHAKRQIRWVVSRATTETELLADFVGELRALAAADPQAVDTTLLIHPDVLQDFHAYNRFLVRADRAIVQQQLQGELQVASFHPQYQFHDCEPDDVANCSNRSPHPMLHLLRESSIDRAVAAFPAAESIYDANIQTLRRLGNDGWAALWGEPGDAAAGPPV
jgi:uncharacterized protein